MLAEWWEPDQAHSLPLQMVQKLCQLGHGGSWILIEVVSS